MSQCVQRGSFGNYCTKRIPGVALVLLLFFFLVQHAQKVTMNNAVFDDFRNDASVLKNQPNEAAPLRDDIPTNVGHTDPENANQQWLAERQRLLKAGGSRKLLMICSMKGGSSIGGEVFHQDPTAVLWYEPAASYFNTYYGMIHLALPSGSLFTENHERIRFSEEEITAMTEFYSNMLTCQYEKLAPQIWMHQFVGTFSKSKPLANLRECRYPSRITFHDHCWQTVRCGITVDHATEMHCHDAIKKARSIIGELTPDERDQLTSATMTDKLIEFISSLPGANMSDFHKTSLRLIGESEICADRVQRNNTGCLRTASEECKKATVQVAEVNRIKMEDVEPLLIANPDLHVLHYLRDPRGTALSRNNSYLGYMLQKKEDGIFFESNFLCDKIREDLRIRHQLEAKYPGAFLETRYEDLVADPIDTASAWYGFMGLEIPPESNWPRYADSAFHSQHDGRLNRMNATLTVNKWMYNIPKPTLDRILEVCKDVLTELGYPL